MFQCEPSFPSSATTAAGTCSPRHNPQLKSITEVSDGVEETTVSFTLCGAPATEVAEEATEAIADDNASEGSHAVFDDTDVESMTNSNEQLAASHNHLSTAKPSSDALTAGAAPAKRPLGASKSMPIETSSPSLTTRKMSAEQCPVSTDGDQCSDTTPEDPQESWDVVEVKNGSKGEPVAPPRRRRRSLFKSKAKRKDQEGAADEDESSNSQTPEELAVTNHRPFRSESDLGRLHSEELQALAAAVAAEEAAAAKLAAASATANSTSSGQPASGAPSGCSTPEPQEDVPDCSAVTHKAKDKDKDKSFMRRLSSKMKIIVRKSMLDDAPDVASSCKQRRSRLDEKFEMIDLTSDEDGKPPVTRRVTYYAHATAGMCCGSSTPPSGLSNKSQASFCAPAATPCQRLFG